MLPVRSLTTLTGPHHRSTQEEEKKEEDQAAAEAADAYLVIKEFHS